MCLHGNDGRAKRWPQNRATMAHVCMHCVYLALWTRKFLCGSYYAPYTFSFIHSFVTEQSDDDWSEFTTMTRGTMIGQNSQRWQEGRWLVRIHNDDKRDDDWSEFTTMTRGTMIGQNSQRWQEGRWLVRIHNDDKRDDDWSEFTTMTRGTMIGQNSQRWQEGRWLVRIHNDDKRDDDWSEFTTMTRGTM